MEDSAKWYNGTTKQYKFKKNKAKERCGWTKKEIETDLNQVVLKYGKEINCCR